MKSQPSLRTLGTLSLTMSSITCIIGSGWLFGAYHAVKVAGPASILSWVVGGMIIALVAMTVIELAVIFPKSGGMVRYLNYSHGSLAGFISGWVGWLAIVSVIPAEATASIQYLCSLGFNYSQYLFDSQTEELTNGGVLAAMGLIFVYFIINYWTVKLLMRFVVAITIIKIAVPLFTIAALYFTSFQSSNFGFSTHEFAPYGWPAILKAVATCGIVFAFNGFQTPLNFAGEAKKPHITLPIAVISAIAITLVMYILLEIVFIGAVSPSLTPENWRGLNFSSPFAELALSLNLNVLLLSIYLDAFISPSATGMTYMGSTTRMLYGMQKHGRVPCFLGKLNKEYLIPRGALWVNFVVSLIFLYFCRSWGNLVAVISVTTVISFITGPIAVMGIRKIAPNLSHRVKVPGLSIVSPLAFVLVSLVFFWSCWPLTGEVILIIALGLCVYFYYEQKNGWVNFAQHFNASRWLIVYFMTMVLLSYLGSKAFGGTGVISEGWDQALVAVFALFFYYWGICSSWRTPELLKAMKQDATLST